MLFPMKRVKFVTTFGGKTDPGGWIVLDLAGADLEGATKLVLPVAELNRVQGEGDRAAERLKKAQSLLGGFDENE